jgi:hypothetical protein
MAQILLFLKGVYQEILGTFSHGQKGTNMQQRFFPCTVARLGAAGLAAALALPMVGAAQQSEQQTQQQREAQQRQEERQRDQEQQQQEERERQEQRQEQQRRQDQQREEQQRQSQPFEQQDRFQQDRFQQDEIDRSEGRAQQFLRERQQRRMERQQARQGDPELGVAIAATQEGLEILRVYPNTAAEQAGLQPGDRIVRFGDQRVRSVEELVQVLQQRDPGESVQVLVDRDGQQATMEVQLQASQRARIYREDMPERFFGEFERRFRQPGFGGNFGPPSSYDDLAAHIQMLQQEIRRLAAEVRDLQVMLEQQPEQAAGRMMEQRRSFQQRSEGFDQGPRYQQEQQNQRFQRNQPFEDESVY